MPKPGRSVWLRVFRGDHWHRHGGCRRRGGRKLRLDVRFRGVGHRAGCVRPVCLGDLQSDDAQTFLIVVREGWHDSHGWRDQFAVSAGSGRSWTSNPTVVVTAGQVAAGFIGIQLAKILGAGTVITAATGDCIDFVNGLGADVVVDYHEQNNLRQLGFPGVR